MRELTGRIFEIREFTLQDGPGIRTTVFLKGCPLRCAWCHNPEGQRFEKETLTRSDGSKVACGEDWTPERLAAELLKNADIFRASGGGVTFSGGEPLAQAEFVLETIARLGDVGAAIETSGAVPPETYRAVASKCAFVYQDLKASDVRKFETWVGGTDETLSQVLANAEWLKTSGIAHAFRVPLMRGVNDSAADCAAFRRLAGASRIEFLPSNPAAGAKYKMLNEPDERSARFRMFESLQLKGEG